MKKNTLSFCLLLILSININAQTKMNLALADKNLNNRSNELIDVFVKGNVSTIEELTKSGSGIFKYAAGDVAVVKIPVSQLGVFVNSKNVERIEAYPNNIQLLSDSMLKHSNVVAVHNGQAPLTQSYDGKGVVIGYIDTGIDYTHPDFKDSLGKTRIKYIWDQTVANGANTPVSFGYGQEWNDSEIDNGQAVTHLTATTKQHGTHVAGVGSGNGRATGIYKGVAPKSDIIMVSLDFALQKSATAVSDAVNYIYSKANLMEKPCVINASFGDYIGSHDGKDLQAQLISNMINAKSGRAFVAAAGNLGTSKIHLGYTVTADTNFTLFKNSTSNVYFQMWADTADFKNVHFSVGADKMLPVHSFRGRLPFSTIANHLGILKTDTLYNNGKRIARIQSLGSLNGGTYLMEFNIIPDSTTYYWRLITTGSGKFDTWDMDMVSSGLPTSATMPDSIYYKYPDLEQNIVSSFQCLNNVITVGNYINRKSILNYNNQLYVDNTKVPGQRFETSSCGPTRDGRIKPDVMSPGEMTISCSLSRLLPADAIAYPDYYDTSGYYIRDGGTSNASPGVAGIAALYLQKYPTATAMDVKNAIINCASQDSFTGNNLPNNIYGYGKANAFNTLTNCGITSITDESINNDFISIYPNPATSEVVVKFDITEFKAIDKIQLHIVNNLGQIIKIQTFNNSKVELANIPSGIYTCNVIVNGKIVGSKKMVIL